MPFQITLQSLQKLQGDITLVTAGNDQIIICGGNLINLQATVEGDVTGNNFLWEQIEGTLVTLQDETTLNASFLNNDLTPKTFRFYINKNTPTQQFDDITVFSTPLSDNVPNLQEDVDIKRLYSKPVTCNSIINNVNVTAPPPNTTTGEPQLINEIRYTWDLQNNFAGELVGNLLGIENIETPDIHYLPNELTDDNIVYDRRGKTNGLVVGAVDSLFGGVFGRMFEFSGGYIDIPAPFFEPNLKQFTFSCFLKIDAVHEGSQVGTLLSITELLSNPTPKFVVSVANGGITVSLRTTLGVETSYSTPPVILSNSNGFVPLVITYYEDPFTVSKYLDVYIDDAHVLSELFLLPGDVNLLQYTRIGANNETVETFNGQLDQIRLYDSKVSSSTINRLLNERTPFIETDNFILNTIPSNVYKGDNVNQLTVIDIMSKNNALLTSNTILTEAELGIGFDSTGDGSGFDCSGVCLNGSFTDLTFSCFFSTRSSSGKQDILFFSEIVDPSLDLSTDAIILSVDSSEIRIYIQKENLSLDLVSSSSPININQTYHLSFSLTAAGNVNVYLDGVILLTGTVPGTFSLFNMPLCKMMSSNNQSTSFDGIIEDVRFYTRELTQSQIQTLANKPSESFKFVKTFLPTDNQEFLGAVPVSSLILAETPISFWEMKDEVGTILTDSIEFNDGIHQGTIEIKEPGLTSDGYSIKLDSSSDYITTTEAYDFIQKTGIFSLQAWIKLDDCRADKINSICGTCFNDPLTDVGFALYYDNRLSEGTPHSVRFLFATGDSNFVTLSADNSIRDNLPHNIWVVGDGITVKMFIDGKLTAQVNLPSTFPTTNATHNFDIGNLYDCDNSQYILNGSFLGNISFVSIHNTPVTAESIERIYISGRYNLLNRIILKSLYLQQNRPDESFSCLRDFSEITIPSATILDDRVYGLTEGNFSTETIRFQNAGFTLDMHDYDVTISEGKMNILFTRYQNIPIPETDPIDTSFYTIYNITPQRFDPGSI